MRVRSALVVLCLLTSACISNRERPPKSMATMQTRGFGSYIEVQGLKGEFLQGELLAVMQEKLWVLDLDGKRQWVKIRYIRAAELYKYESDWGFGGWGLVGALSTASHGFLLILTFPIWVLSASIAAAVESRSIRLQYPETDIEEFAKWARFPQGMPVDAAPVVPALPPREQAWGLTKQAMAAARADDCNAVRELDVRVRDLDAEMHAATFIRDEAIRRCLGLPSLLFPPQSGLAPPSASTPTP